MTEQAHRVNIDAGQQRSPVEPRVIDAGDAPVKEVKILDAGQGERESPNPCVSGDAGCARPLPA